MPFQSPNQWCRNTDETLKALTLARNEVLDMRKSAHFSTFRPCSATEKKMYSGEAVMYNMCGGNNKPHFVITSNKLPSLKVKQITTCGFVSGALFTILSSKPLGYGPCYLPPTRAMSLTCLYFPAAEHHRILAGAYSTSRRGRRLSWSG